MELAFGFQHALTGQHLTWLLQVRIGRLKKTGTCSTAGMKVIRARVDGAYTKIMRLPFVRGLQINDHISSRTPSVDLP